MEKQSFKLSNQIYFLRLIALWPSVGLLATNSIYITYINFFYLVFLFVYALRIAAWRQNFWKIFASSSVLFCLYIIFFMITTFLGVDHNYSMLLKYYTMPISLTSVLIFFVAGYYFDERLFVKEFVALVSLYTLLSIGAVATNLVDFSQTRIIAGLDVPLAIAAAAIYSQFVLMFVLLIGSIVSLKKTVIICSIIGLLPLLFLKRNETLIKVKKKLNIKRVMLALLVIVSLIIFASTISELLEATLTRVMVEGVEDKNRLVQLNEYLRLLGEYFPRGTGYYTFGSLTMESIPYETLNADGSVFYGVSLHNTIMHITLEGGLAVSAIAFALYWKSFRAVRYLYKFSQSRNLAVLLYSWLFVSITYGFFNQLHSQVYFFGILAYIFGAHARYLASSLAINRSQHY